jgi:formamidopyrimidine-DNA glycosylase
VPELPDIALYLTALEPRVVGRRLLRVRLFSPFLLRSVEPALESVHEKRVVGLERMGKRVVLGLEGELFLVIHLMIAGRFRYLEPASSEPRPGGKIALAAFEFEHVALVLTEAGSKRRASLHLVRGREALAAHDPGGIDPMSASLEAFTLALRRENHTVKRALTDPRALSGIGNAYSDEILFRAKLSPVKWTSRLSEEEIEQLRGATREVLKEWIERLAAQTGSDFPTKVTAFRPEMAVHGRYKEPCPVCGAPVQRIVHAESESNYCARCQTGGKVLADRSLSKLLKDDWPRTIEEWEAMRER